jgi:hypothetical protein
MNETPADPNNMPSFATDGLGIPWVEVATGGVGWSEFTDTAQRLYPQIRNRVDAADILIMNGGQGDFIDALLTGAAAYTAMTNYADAARAQGFDYIIACSMPMMGSNMLGSGRLTAPEQAQVAIYNNLINTNSGGHFDRTVDLTSVLNDPLDTTYYQFDQLHLTEAGAELGGLEVRSVIVELVETEGLL